MRTRLVTACATIALALCTASPALAGEHEPQEQAGHAQAAKQLLKAADRFDQKAGKMRTRATRLRASALELRKEAEELAAADTADPTTPDPATPDGAAARMDDQEEPTTTEEEEAPCGDWEAEDMEAAREHPADSTTGDDAAPTDGGEDAPDAEVCELLRLATRLERRADALDVAAKRMEYHATYLRAKAAKFLTKAGETDAQRLLAKATRLRAQAAEMRARADRLRDGAFTGTDVDEDVIERIAYLEVKAARFDGAADRLEARATRLAATPV